MNTIVRQYAYVGGRGIDPSLILGKSKFVTRNVFGPRFDPAFHEMIFAYLRTGFSPKALVALKTRFSTMDKPHKMDNYQGVIACFKFGVDQDKRTTFNYFFDDDHELKLPSEDVEKINKLLICLEEDLGLPHGQGYRYSYAEGKEMSIAGIAKDYNYKGIPIREYVSLEFCISTNLLAVGKSRHEGFVDNDRVILMYAPLEDGEINSYWSLVNDNEVKRSLNLPPIYGDEIKILRKILELISGTIEFGPEEQARYYDLGLENIREHEAGHVFSLQVNDNLEALYKINFNLGASFTIFTISELMADFLGPLTLIEETAKSDPAKANKLFWTFVFRRFINGIAMGDFRDPFDQRYHDEFILRLIPSLIKTTNQDGQPSYGVDLEYLAEIKRNFLLLAKETLDMFTDLVKENTMDVERDKLVDIEYRFLSLVRDRYEIKYPIYGRVNGCITLKCFLQQLWDIK